MATKSSSKTKPKKGSAEKNIFSGKKVLVFGLGILGGGVSTANWLIRHGAKVTITDLKNKRQLAPSLKQIKGKAKLRLGGHNEDDIKFNDVIVINPDVSIINPYVKMAQEMGKDIENEATIFYGLCPKPIIAVTGTRGKTTTVNWIRHFLGGKAAMAGNSFSYPLLKMLDKMDKYTMAVNELPSFHLELFPYVDKGPDVAVITNIYQDHLNRYASMADYAATKANVFTKQNENQNLILNADNQWTPFFVRRKPKSKIWYFSMAPLDSKSRGVFFKEDGIYLQIDGKAGKVLNMIGFIEKWGEHNLQNLLVSSLAAYLGGVSWKNMQQAIRTLPEVPFRQEVIYQNRRIKIINDTGATSPDGGIAAIKRFGSPTCVLITGGTDRQLEYDEWAKVALQHFKPENLIMLSGSATDKMRKELGTMGGKIKVYDDLKDCIRAGLQRAYTYPNSVLLFSPASKSFEKFKNEYDRGRQFNRIIKREVKNGGYAL